MALTPTHFAPEEVRRITRLLTRPLAREALPPRRLEVHVGKGYHLLLHGLGHRIFHAILTPVGVGHTGVITTPSTTLIFRCAGCPSVVERRWLGALRRGLRLTERDPGWADFLAWAIRQPAVMLPDATFDPDRDPSTGNLECIRVETRCNGRCAFCSARGILPDLVLDAQVIVERLRSMRRAGRQEVAFSGGEPTLRPDLPVLVAHAREEGFATISLQTNAILLDRGPLLDHLLEAGLTSIFVPLLSHEAATHDRLIGVRGAFERTLAGIDRCRGGGLNVSFNTVITTVNLAHLEQLVAWLPERFPSPRPRGNISFVALQGWTIDHLELVPRLAAVRGPLQAALDAVDRLGLEITIPGICGLPICVLPGYERHFDEYHRGFQGLPDNRRYTAACVTCPFRSRCSGFWSAYLDHFGEEDLGYRPGTVPPG